MPATWQIDEWKIGPTVLVRALEMVDPWKMGTGNKVLRNTTSEPIKHAKSQDRRARCLDRGAEPADMPQRTKRRETTGRRGRQRSACHADCHGRGRGSKPRQSTPRNTR